MRMLKRIVGAVAMLGLLTVAAFAQVPSTSPPYNTDLGAVITNALRVPGTVTSAQQDNLDGTGVICVFVMTASSGGPSTVFKLQGYDAASATYYDLGASGAITVLNTPTALMIKPGLASGDDTAPNVALGLPVPRKWRVSQTITGATTAVTGTIGCNKLR